jgi:hypothetical protein
MWCLQVYEVAESSHSQGPHARSSHHDIKRSWCNPLLREERRDLRTTGRNNGASNDVHKRPVNFEHKAE